MAGNTFGVLFRVTTFGESHGKALGCIVDGCPPGLTLSEEYIQRELDRRRPGKSSLETPRKERDRVQILSGIFEGLTTGHPIALIVHNEDIQSSAYEPLKEVFRPGHADFTYFMKYRVRDHRGGGRASGRETVARVAAGAVAKRVLEEYKIEVTAYTLSLGVVKVKEIDLTQVDQNPLYCPDPEAFTLMQEVIENARKEGDSIGGVVEVLVRGTPIGLGEPVFDKLSADLAKALCSIPAVKGFEMGAGFKASELKGSENNDPISAQGFLKNDAGGTLGGLSTGQDLLVRIAVKPIPSIRKPQRTVNLQGQEVEVVVGGRHDVSAIPRIIPVAEAMVRIVLADHLLRQLAYLAYREKIPFPKFFST